MPAPWVMTVLFYAAVVLLVHTPSCLGVDLPPGTNLTATVTDNRYEYIISGGNRTNGVRIAFETVATTGPSVFRAHVRDVVFTNMSYLTIIGWLSRPQCAQCSASVTISGCSFESSALIVMGNFSGATIQVSNCEFRPNAALLTMPSTFIPSTLEMFGLLLYSLTLTGASLVMSGLNCTVTRDVTSSCIGLKAHVEVRNKATLQLVNPALALKSGAVVQYGLFRDPSCRLVVVQSSSLQFVNTRIQVNKGMGMCLDTSGVTNIMSLGQSSAILFRQNTIVVEVTGDAHWHAVSMSGENDQTITGIADGSVLAWINNTFNSYAHNIAILGLTKWPLSNSSSLYFINNTCITERHAVSFISGTMGVFSGNVTIVSMQNTYGTNVDQFWGGSLLGSPGYTFIAGCDRDTAGFSYCCLGTTYGGKLGGSFLDPASAVYLPANCSGVCRIGAPCFAPNTASTSLASGSCVCRCIEGNDRYCIPGLSTVRQPTITVAPSNELSLETSASQSVSASHSRSGTLALLTRTCTVSLSASPFTTASFSANTIKRTQSVSRGWTKSTTNEVTMTLSAMASHTPSSGNTATRSVSMSWTPRRSHTDSNIWRTFPRGGRCITLTGTMSNRTLLSKIQTEEEKNSKIQVAVIAQHGKNFLWVTVVVTP